MYEGMWFLPFYVWELLKKPNQCSSTERKKWKFPFGTGGHVPMHWEPELVFQNAGRVLRADGAIAALG